MKTEKRSKVWSWGTSRFRSQEKANEPVKRLREWPVRKKED